MTAARVEIDRALRNRQLLGAALGPLDSWRTWGIALKAAFALPLAEHEREVFGTIAGERGLPTQRARELWAVCGRRSGKSRMAAAVAVYLTLFQEYRLAPGEKGMCLVIAGTTEQAKVVFNYVRGFLEAAPALAREIAGITRQEVELRNGIIIGVHSNRFRSVRGPTMVAAIFDENGVLA